MWTTLWDHPMLPLQWGVVIAVALIGAVSDLGVRKVPNLLTGPALLAGLVWATWTAGLAGLADAGAGCVLLAVPYVLLFVFAGGGAGDAKLMGAIGAWLGVLNGLVVLASVALSGVVLAIGYSLARRRLGAVLTNLGRVAYSVLLLVSVRGRLRDARCMLPETREMETFPYGLAVFGGVCLAAGGLCVWRFYSW